MQVERGLKSFGGYVLAKRVQHIALVPPFPAQLNILGEGALVTLSGEKKVAILVRDLPGVRMEIGRVLPSQLQHLVSQTSGNFARPEFTSGLGSDNLTERFERKIPLLNLKQGKAHYEALNLAEYLGKDATERRGIFLLSVQGYDPRTDDNPPAAGRNAEPANEAEGEGEGETEGAGEATGNPGERRDSRLLLVTDLGILVKRLRGPRMSSCSRSRRACPWGASVEVIGKNGLVLLPSYKRHGRASFEAGRPHARAPATLPRAQGRRHELPAAQPPRPRPGLLALRRGQHPQHRAARKLSAYLFSDRGMYARGTFPSA